MEDYQTYRNKKARIHVLSGATEFQPGAFADAARDAAYQRILAKKVEEGEAVFGSNLKPIPAGYYAMSDDGGQTIVASEPTFFESIYELDLPRQTPTA